MPGDPLTNKLITTAPDVGGTCPTTIGEAQQSSLDHTCFGFVDFTYTNPNLPNSSDARAGFDLQGIVQFFNLGGYPATNLRKHSAIQLHWNSVGNMLWVEKDNYKGDITKTLLWVNNEALQQVEDDSLLEDASSCPLQFFTPASSDETGQTSGCLARMYTLRGNYGYESSDTLFRYASNGLEDHSSDGTGCGGSVKVLYGSAEFQCGTVISSDEPNLQDDLLEMAWEINSDGTLDKIYLGGQLQCDDNPCVWHRNAPPKDANGDTLPGVVVPVVRFVNDADDNNFEVWLIHFTSKGTYMYSCLYATICGCDVTTTGGGASPPCVCEEFACIVTGNCTRPDDANYCTDIPTATFTCAEAAVNAGNCEPVENLFCVYNATDGCCTPGEETNLSSIRPPETDPGEEACLYQQDSAFESCTE